MENELNLLRSTMPSPAAAEEFVSLNFRAFRFSLVFSFQIFAKLVEEQAEQLRNLTEENQSIAEQLQSQTEFYQQQKFLLFSLFSFSIRFLVKN